MRSLKMISVMLLASFSLCGFSGCEEKYDIDKSIFSWEHQKFYQSNAATGKKAEFTCEDQRADKLVCVPSEQYIKFFEDYVCTKRK
jgi:hypothetical protein